MSKKKKKKKGRERKRKKEKERERNRKEQLDQEWSTHERNRIKVGTTVAGFGQQEG